MKLLVITYSYTPDLTPRAFRWSAVSAYLAGRGHQVHVLCAAAPSATLAVSEGVSVYRVRDWLLNASARVTPGAGTSEPASAGGGIVSLRGHLRKAVRAIWRAVYWPDFACGWVIPAARVARALCRENHYDWIISSSHPFTGHVIGMLARLRSPKSRWLVDISDPYSDMKEPSPNNRRFYGWLNRAVECNVLARADAISVTTDSTRQMYETSFSCAYGKILVVPPLLSLPEFPRPTEIPGVRTLRLVFVGTLYRKLRSPKYLLSCVAALRKVMPEQPLELHCYGTINDCSDDFSSCPDAIKSIVFVHGLVSRERVVQAMIDSDVLVNIGNDSETQLASKVVEYMAAGKPILNLVSIARDASITALADYPAKLTVMRSGEAPSAEEVEALRSFVLHPIPVDQDFVEIVRRRFSDKNVAGLYESILLQSSAKVPAR
jgi:glycosyltransferase involved in cell wall biosynthesis